MNTERLLKLADYLYNDVSRCRKRFNMNYWAKGKFCGLKSEPTHDENICNSSACAMGWATTIPSFRKAGLILQPLYIGLDGRQYFEIVYKKQRGIHAAEKFLAISYDEAYYLFVPESYSKAPSPKQVAIRIRSLVHKERVKNVA